PGELVGALLHGEIFDDPLLDLLQAEVIVVENLLGKLEVLLDLGLLVPRDRQEPVEVVAHHSGFRRHRRHLPELLELVRRLLARLLRELGLLDLVFDLGQLVLALLVAELLLDRLHLLVKKKLALGLLHLAFDAGADALVDLQHRNLAVDQAEALREPAGDRRGLQDRLPVGNLEGQVRGHGVGERGIVLDLLDDADHLGRHPLVELRVALEVIGDRAREGLRFDAFTHRVAQRDRLGLVILAAIGVLDQFGALSALDQYLDRAVGEPKQLRHARKRANLVDRLRCRIVVGRVLLGGEQDEGVGPHRLLEREDRLLASDEEGHDRVRKYDNVAQRQHRIGPGLTGNEWWSRLSAGHGPKSVLLSLCLLKTSSAAEILVITDPNADRNKIEISSLYSDEKIPCSLPKISCSLQKISLLVPPGAPILSRPGFISLHGPSESRTSGTTKP